MKIYQTEEISFVLTFVISGILNYNNQARINAKGKPIQHTKNNTQTSDIQNNNSIRINQRSRAYYNISKLNHSHLSMHSFSPKDSIYQPSQTGYGKKAILQANVSAFGETSPYELTLF